MSEKNRSKNDTDQFVTCGTRLCTARLLGLGLTDITRVFGKPENQMTFDLVIKRFYDRRALNIKDN